MCDNLKCLKLYNLNIHIQDVPDRYSQQPSDRNGSPSSGIVPVAVAAGAVAGAASQADWVRNKHTGKKGEFRYF